MGVVRTISEAKADANARNAKCSTGPRSARGKSRSARNGITHGILSRLEVLPGLESPEEWQAHREAVLGELAPAGHLETTLAERVALALWRLGRVARYEARETAAVIERKASSYSTTLNRQSAALDGAGGALRALADTAGRERRQALAATLDKLDDGEAVDGPDAEALVRGMAEALGVNIYSDIGREVEAEIEDWPDDGHWTAGALVSCLAEIAGCRGLELATTLETASTSMGQGELVDTQQTAPAPLPDTRVLDRVQRHETHLERSLGRMLHELREVQRARREREAAGAEAPRAGVTLDGEGAEATG